MPRKKHNDYAHRDLGRRLRRIRYFLGYGKGMGKQWARFFQVAYNSWNEWETGETRLPLRIAERLCQMEMLSDLDIHWLYLGVPGPRKLTFVRRLEAIVLEDE
jgi:hypothetical protein